MTEPTHELTVDPKDADFCSCARCGGRTAVPLTWAPAHSVSTPSRRLVAPRRAQAKNLREGGLRS
jgi:hypothetical protein